MLSSKTIVIPEALSRAPGDSLWVFRNIKKIFEIEIKVVNVQIPIPIINRSGFRIVKVRINKVIKNPPRKIPLYNQTR